MLLISNNDILAQGPAVPDRLLQPVRIENSTGLWAVPQCLAFFGCVYSEPRNHVESPIGKMICAYI